MKFLILDVFAEKKYAGNQLAVVFGAGGLATGAMQTLAREFGFAETTFLLADAAGPKGWPVRIFTPGEEVPFAGHPTLGTSWAIANELLGSGVEELVLDLAAGQIPVRFERGAEGEVLWMRQLPPSFGPTVPASFAARLLGLDEAQVDPRFPAQHVSTGLPFLIVPLCDLAAVAAARPNLAAFAELAGNGPAKAVFLFTAGAFEPGNQVHARMFAPEHGVIEDAATGSANGCLAGYLAHHRFFGDSDVAVRVEQGYEMGRPSLLRLRAHERDQEIEVQVGGRVVLVARGELA